MTISTNPEDINSTETILHYMDSYPVSGQNRAAAKLIRKLLAAAPLVTATDNKTDTIKLALSMLSEGSYMRGVCIDLKNHLFAALACQVAQTETVHDKKIRAVETPADYPIEDIFSQVALQATVTDEMVKEFIADFHANNHADYAEQIKRALCAALATPPTSKADTVEAIRNAALEDAACDLERRNMQLFAQHNFYLCAAANIRALKSTTPSTIKAEPIGEQS